MYVRAIQVLMADRRMEAVQGTTGKMVAQLPPSFILNIAPISTTTRVAKQRLRRRYVNLKSEDGKIMILSLITNGTNGVAIGRGSGRD